MRAWVSNENIQGGYVMDWIKFEKGSIEFTIDLQGTHEYDSCYFNDYFKGDGYLWESIFEEVNLLNEEVELTNSQIEHLCEQDWDSITIGIYPIEEDHEMVEFPTVTLRISTDNNIYNFKDCEVQDNYFN